MSRARRSLSRACRAIPRALGLLRDGVGRCFVVTENLGDPKPAAFTDHDRARRYLRFVQGQLEAAGDDPVDWHISEVSLDPRSGNRPGAWVVCIDREGRPVGPARFSLARCPNDPPHELEFRYDVEPMREVRDFVGYGRTRAEARASAEELRMRSIGP